MAYPAENLLLRRYIDKAMVDLPAMPGVVLQVIQATDKDTTSAADIERLLSTDAAIATKLLKVVNSAYFGLPRQITNINQTVTILGMHQVRNLVMSIGVLNIMNSPSPRLVETQKAFWQHSFGAASCAELLAKAKNLPRKDVEMAFVGGILHDIGRLFLLTMFNLAYRDVLQQSLATMKPVDDVERAVLGVSRTELAGILAERWNFPSNLVGVIRNHAPLPAKDVDPVLYAVHLAHFVANTVSPPELTGIYRGPDRRAVEWLGASDEQFEQLKGVTLAAVQRAKELFGVM